ncbi:MAG: choice-of-anchor I domain-containing protein [Gammaproteobacteria bacterium]
MFISFMVFPIPHFNYAVRSVRFIIRALAALLVLSACAIIQPSVPQQWAIEPVSLYDSGYDEGTEIISVQQSTLRAILNNYQTGEVDVLDISRPGHLQRIARFDLKLCRDEELTSVAFHPELDLFAATIDAGIKPGRLEIRSASTGALIDRIVVGFGPDAVVFSGDGKLAVIANEGEDFLFEPDGQRFFKPEGSISIVRLSQSGRVVHHKNLELASTINEEGFVVTQGGRFMERAIDWNGDGKISQAIDFDGNGKIESKKMLLGSFEGHDVYGVETSGERKILIPINGHSLALLEPEYISITPDGKLAYVTLQEDDAVVKVDLIQKRIAGYYALGAAQHKIDARYDGWIQFDQPMTGLREPDGIALAANGRFFVTADEGDTDRDPSDPGQPMSGGRSVSVFDAKTGALLGDTGSQLDEAAFAHQVYPERRSGAKGSEPEMLVSFDLEGVPFVAVGLERAASVALVSLADPYHPEVVALGKIAGDEDKSPEGIAHYIVSGEHYILTANELNGTVECFKIVKKINEH